MSSPLNGEILPLLGLARPQRIHYVDNLRATLTVALIFHHAAVECGSAYLPTALLINVNKYALWGLFFFVSGYSSALSLASHPSDLRLLVSRTVRIGLPAWIYAIVGHRFLFLILTLGWSDVFGKHKTGWIYARLSGPVAYVLILLVMDYTHLFIRWINREFPHTNHPALVALVRPNSRQKFFSNVGYVVILLNFFIFLRCLGFQIAPSSLYIIQSNDFPAFDAPLSYVIAYVVGVNFDVIKEYTSINLPIGYLWLFLSVIFSYVSLGVAEQFSASLSQFIRTRDQYVFYNAGLNAHTVFYVLWSTFVFFSIPISILSIFSRASWATREWGFLARHTYSQMYINMVPVLVAAHYTGWFADATSRILLVGVSGVVVSWIGMTGGILLWMKISPLLQRSRAA